MLKIVPNLPIIGTFSQYRKKISLNFKKEILVVILLIVILAVLVMILGMTSYKSSQTRKEIEDAFNGRSQINQKISHNNSKNKTDLINNLVKSAKLF